MKPIKDTKDSPNITCADPRVPPAKIKSLLTNGNELTTSKARANRLKHPTSKSTALSEYYSSVVGEENKRKIPN